MHNRSGGEKKSYKVLSGSTAVNAGRGEFLLSDKHLLNFAM